MCCIKTSQGFRHQHTMQFCSFWVFYNIDIFLHMNVMHGYTGVMGNGGYQTGADKKESFLSTALNKTCTYSFVIHSAYLCVQQCQDETMLAEKLGEEDIGRKKTLLLFSVQ